MAIIDFEDTVLAHYPIDLAVVCHELLDEPHSYKVLSKLLLSSYNTKLSRDAPHWIKM